MEDEKPEAGGHDFAFKILFFILLFTMLGTLAEGTFLGPLLSGDARESLNSSEIRLGDDVVNLDKTDIRQSPGGALIGAQDERVKGRVIEGSIQNFGIDWWRVDYSDAPDGWVRSEDITNSIGLFTTLNFFPIVGGFLRPIFTIVGVILFILLMIVVIKMVDLNKVGRKRKQVQEEQKLYKEGHSAPPSSGEISVEDDLPVSNLPIGEKPATKDVHNRRWANIQTLIHSYNTNDWKQAIIEADVILEEMLDKMGYKGNSIGDQLKQIEASDFATLNQAWEAHKIRNRVAHDGSNYVLSKDEAERIIGLYASVFNEFFYI